MRKGKRGVKSVWELEEGKGKENKQEGGEQKRNRW